MIRVKIQADGSPCGTQITTEDGRDLGGSVTGVTFRHDAGNIPVAELTIGFVEIEYEGLAKLYGPGGKEVARIEYADGTFEEFSHVRVRYEAVGNPRALVLKGRPA